MPFRLGLPELIIILLIVIFDIFGVIWLVERVRGARREFRKGVQGKAEVKAVPPNAEISDNVDKSKPLKKGF